MKFGEKISRAIKKIKGKCILKANKTYVMFEITDKKDRN